MLTVYNYNEFENKKLILVEAQNHNIGTGLTTIVSRLDVRKFNKISVAAAAPIPPFTIYYRPRMSTEKITFNKFNTLPINLLTLAGQETFKVMDIPVDMPFYFIDIMAEHFDAKSQNIDLVVFGI